MKTRTRVLIPLALGLLAAVLLCPVPASAQYVFLDVNGDGSCTAADVLTDAVTSIDIWFDTAHNGDGSPAMCSAGGPLDIFSYEFILTSGGNVTYGAYTNMMATFTTPFGVASGGNDYHNGYGGMAPLPPGAYKVGSLAISVAPGT